MKISKERLTIREERKKLQEAGDDLGMMKRPKLWPHFGRLPMKRVRDGKLETGVLKTGYSIENGGARSHYVWVPHSTMFEFVPINDYRVIIDPDLKAIVDDGWKVD